MMSTHFILELDTLPIYYELLIILILIIDQLCQYFHSVPVTLATTLPVRVNVSVQAM